jgi:hypothetical protein
MRDDHSRGVVAEGFFHDFAGVDRCAVDGAAKQVLAGNQSVAGSRLAQHDDDVRASRSGFEAPGADAGVPGRTAPAAGRGQVSLGRLDVMGWLRRL